MLVPTDGSEAAEATVEKALEIARTLDATIHVLYVVDTRAIHPGGRNPLLLEEFHETGEQLIDDLVDRIERTSDVPVTGAVVEGTPYEEICDYASDHDVDVIVMGTQGRTGMKRYLIGSVTENVIRASAVPVLTVPSAAHS